MQGFKNIWDIAVDRLAGSISDAAMDLWIRPIKPVKYEDNSAILLVESEFHRDVIMSKYRDILRKTLSDIVGFEMDVLVTADDKKYNTKPAKEEEEKPAPATKEINLDAISDISFPEYTRCV